MSMNMDEEGKNFYDENEAIVDTII